MPVPLSTSTQTQTQSDPLSIAHQGQFPAVTISFNLAGQYSLGQALDAMKKVIAESHLPAVLGVLYESFVHPITPLDVNLEKGRYETGLDPYLSLVTAQVTLLSNQQTKVTLRVSEMTAAIELIEALGAAGSCRTPYPVKNHHIYRSDARLPDSRPPNRLCASPVPCRLRAIPANAAVPSLITDLGGNVAPVAGTGLADGLRRTVRRKSRQDAGLCGTRDRPRAPPPGSCAQPFGPAVSGSEGIGQQTGTTSLAVRVAFALPLTERKKSYFLDSSDPGTASSERNKKPAGVC